MKIRIDEYLVKKFAVESREKAKRLILAGQVYDQAGLITKPGQLINPENQKIILKNNEEKYLSRGGLKLEKALEVFTIDVKNKNCLDVGSSTGGFTDCLLQHGAAHVVATDVGTNQLHYRLRTNKNVSVKENFNFRHATYDDFCQKFDFICCDVSFISLKKIIPPMKNLLKEHGEIVVLIKPQFEAGREKINNGVADPKLHPGIIEDIKNFVKSIGLKFYGVSPSPIKGNKKNNIEYITYIRKN